MKLIPLIIIPIVVLEVIEGHVANKCCKQGEVLRVVEGRFECTEDPSRRVQVRANATDFLKKNESGLCVDVLGSEVFVFNISDEGIDLERAPDSYFPKCCPLDHVYSTVIRGCVKKSDAADFYQEPFVHVGLANCQLVVDSILNGTDDSWYRLHERTGGFERNASHPGSYCIDRTENGSLVLRECLESLQACEGIRCIKKCCPDGQSYVKVNNRSQCVHTYEHGLNLSVFGNVVEKPRDPFAIIYRAGCKSFFKNDDNFTLDERGVFTQTGNSFNFSDDVGDLHSYCIEYSKRDDGEGEGYYFFYCLPDTEDSLTKFDYTFWPLVISCVFLALTVAIYVVQNETKKMFGKILVNYCVAMFFSFFFLTYAQLNLSPTPTECLMKAFAIIFFAVASFTWSNIMCCDIWSTFGSTKRYLGTNQRKMDLTKLLLYSLYGWGVPLLLTCVIYIFHKWRVLPDSIQPFLGEVKCFFDNKPKNFAKDLFYNIPLLIIQMTNMALFTKTVIYCLEVKNDINRINDTTKDDKMKRYQSDKERLFLILKLLVIMGMSYIFEVVSAFLEMGKMGTIPKYIEIVWDTINALQGFFIFVIFICKKRIIKGCLQKLKLMEKPASSSSSFRTSSLNLISVNGFSLNHAGATNKGFK